MSFILGDRVKRTELQGEFIVIGLSKDRDLATISNGPISHGCTATFTHPTAGLELVRRGEFKEQHGYIVKA